VIVRRSYGKWNRHQPIPDRYCVPRSPEPEAPRKYMFEGTIRGPPPASRGAARTRRRTRVRSAHRLSLPTTLRAGATGDRGTLAVLAVDLPPLGLPLP
jgi:hypothetical protein